jgi:hypothetical protein
MESLSEFEPSEKFDGLLRHDCLILKSVQIQNARMPHDFPYYLSGMHRSVSCDKDACLYKIIYHVTVFSEMSNDRKQIVLSVES